jgi:hypothetical protein
MVSVVALLCLGLTVGLAGTAAAKRKTVDITNAAPTTIPDRAPGGGLAGVLRSTIEVPKRFRGLRIRDVNVTLHVVGTGTNSVVGLRGQLTAPDGATTRLFANLGPGNLLGPVTFDDESQYLIFNGTVGQAQPFSLTVPWQGTARPGAFPNNNFPLSVMDDGPARRTWTLTIVDLVNGGTNVLNSWRLEVRAGKPFRKKRGDG